MTGEIFSDSRLPKPGTATVDTLTEIWRRVLRQPNIGPEDDFPDLGGHDALADRVFAEIARVFGRQLPSATIYHAPTIAALAAVLEQPALPRFSPLVKLKAGPGNTPIYIAPGLDGRARFSKLAKHIRTDHSIYGIQAKGVDGLEEPHVRIEDMAEFYLEALDEFQPAGPYLLIGYSFGGLVALEMAQRLVESGKKVALLALVDTYPHPRFLSPGERVRLMARRTGRHLSDMKRMPVGEAVPYFIRKLERRLPITRSRSRGKPPAGASPLSLAHTTVRVHETAYMAYGRYRPRFYRGRIKFVRAEVNPYFPDDPTAVWSKLAEGFEVSTVPGGHLDMVTTGFQSLADVLTGYLGGSPCAG
jgi:acetoacetyl-CoA synthetase